MQGDYDLLRRLDRIEWRLEALDDWRAKVESWRGAVDDNLGQMLRADEIADAVAKRMDARGPVVPLSWGWKLVLAVAALVSVAGGLKGLIA